MSGRVLFCLHGRFCLVHFGRHLRGLDLSELRCLDSCCGNVGDERAIDASPHRSCRGFGISVGRRFGTERTSIASFIIAVMISAPRVARSIPALTIVTVRASAASVVLAVMLNGTPALAHGRTSSVAEAATGASQILVLAVPLVASRVARASGRGLGRCDGWL